MILFSISRVILFSISRVIYFLFLPYRFNRLLSSPRDRFITVVNVVGDAMGTGIIQHLSRDELNEAEEINNNPGGAIFTEKFMDGDGPDAYLMTSGV